MQLLDLRAYADRDVFLSLLWLRRTGLDELAICSQLTFTDPVGTTRREYCKTATHLGVPRHYRHPSFAGRLGSALNLDAPGDPLPHWEDRVTKFLDAHQEQAWRGLAASTGGVLCLAGGRGKTVLAAKKICQRGRCTIVFAHTIDIVRQWAGQLEKWAGVPAADIGILGGPEGSLEALGKPICVATVQSLMDRTEAINPWVRRHFGTIAFDEVHHFSSPVFSRILPVFQGARYGFSATPERLDNLQNIVAYHVGPIVYRSTFHTLQPKVQIAWLPTFNITEPHLHDRCGVFSCPKLYTWLGRDGNRNRIIVADALADLAAGRKLMLLTHSKPHVDRLWRKLPGAGRIHGDVPQDERKEALGHNLVVAIVQLGAEALDKVDLDTLYITTPMSAKEGQDGRFQQAVWRTLRDVVAKQPPLVRIYCDPHPVCVSLIRKLAAAAREHGYELEERTAAGVVRPLEGLPALPAGTNPPERGAWGGQSRSMLAGPWDYAWRGGGRGGSATRRPLGG